MSSVFDPPSALQSQTSSHLAGLGDQLQELPPQQLAVEGELPTWLTGGLVRVTPGQKDFGERTVSHWFDGAAMLHRFGITNGAVTYSNRFLETQFRRAAIASGGGSIQGFATDPCRTLFQRVQSVFRQPPLDNANVNLTTLGDEHLALTETPMAVRFDWETLATTGVDALPTTLGQVTTAHPQYDRERNELINFTVDMGPRTRYRLYGRTGPDAEQLRTIATMPTREPAYMHSFAVTARHFLLIENPLVVNPVRLITELTVKAGSFITQYRWKPELGLRIHAFDLASGQLEQSWTAEPCFLFHTINAYEQDGEIRLDACVFEDASIIDELAMERMAAGDSGFTLTPPMPTRFTLPLAGGPVQQRTLSDATDLELPRINYGRHNGRPYRYAYGNATSGAAFLKDIVKLDVESGEYRGWSEDDQWAGEPVFVARPDATEEDDGVLLSVVLDGISGTSYLLVLDAVDLSELARAHAPHMVPLGFHGQWVTAPARTGPRGGPDDALVS